MAGDHLNSDELKRCLLSWALTTESSPLFKGSSAKLGSWFLTIERACRQSRIPDTQRTEAAIHLIYDESPLADVMKERERVYKEKSGEAYWPWADFERDIVAIVMKSDKRMTILLCGIFADNCTRRVGPGRKSPE